MIIDYGIITLSYPRQSAWKAAGQSSQQISLPPLSQIPQTSKLLSTNTFLEFCYP
jgi:hypothetical protein